ncbi:hypothetical protein JCM7447_15800 [Corynebacterium amycolatum]
MTSANVLTELHPVSAETKVEFGMVSAAGGSMLIPTEACPRAKKCALVIRTSSGVATGCSL